MSEQDTGPTVGARGISFENRIAISALVTAVVVLLTASGLFILEQWQAERHDLKRQETALASVVGSSLAPFAAANDAAGAQRILASLADAPSVRAATLIDAQGRVVARYRSDGGASGSPIALNTPLTLGGRPVGGLTIEATGADLDNILPRYLAVCAALFFAAAGLALFMGRWLAGRVMDPVNRLSQAMREVTDSADYSQRLPLWAQDEFGLLTETFNHLLAQLQANDNALHRAMTELVSARDAAQAANVLKSQFLANMSHEIRTPLNGVLAMAQIIALGDLSPVQRERVDVIRRSGEDLLAVLNDILDLSKIEAGKMEIDAGEVDAEALGRNVHAVFNAVAETKPGLRFVLKLADGAEGPRRGDPARISQILNNLVSNALKFTAEGEVSVTIAGQGEGGDAGLRLVVADTGIGIAADKLPMLFEKFSQADGSNTRRYGGTGLGLAISRELARLMGGSIEVASVEGRGSTFTVNLPLPRIPRSAAAEPEVVAAPAEPQDRPLRVLAAEDIPTNQLVLRTIMQTFGVELKMVDNGRQAVEAWKLEDFDVILMDIQMPEMDGLAATRAIRALEDVTVRPRTPIIAVSANAMAHQVEEYLAAGMDGHVAKPIELVKLHAAIETALTPRSEMAVA
ncbi:MAG: ATP-binding protein [Caulobacteraceae bacterium]|nr:ATP-binding protein [Caulobacteraceae bacterium]